MVGRMTKHLILGTMILAACSKGSDAPPKPADGSPMVFEVTSLKPGKTFDSEVGVRAYNFSDKPIANYSVLLRYRDAKGELLEMKSAFGDETLTRYSFQAKKYVCQPKTWCTWTIEPEVPEGAVKAEMVADALTAVKADGMTMEEEPLFDRPGIGREWPETTAAAKPVEAK